jgi:predicted alpha/beta hydrolase family esterase
MTRIFILHGWGGDSATNWFPWLKAYAEKKGNEVFVPNFPNTEFPIYDEWNNHWAELYATEIEKSSIFVAHSLGSSFLLRWFSENPISIEKLILVAPAPDDCGIDEIRSFFTASWDVKTLKQNVQKIELLCSDNDPYIPIQKFETLAKTLGVTLKKYPGRGHLNGEKLSEILPFLT